MNSRKMITVAMLFAMAAAALVVLNRIPFFNEREALDGDAAFERQDEGLRRAEFYDSARGVKTGQLTARRFDTLEDGAIEAHDVEIALWETEVGDVSISAHTARVTMQRAERGYAGRFELAGDIDFHAESPEREFVGSFEHMTYNSTDNVIDASGPFEMSSPGAISVFGTDLSGNIREGEMRFTARRHILVQIEQQTLTGAGISGGTMTIEAGGPLIFDGPAGRVTFAGEVAVSSEEMRLNGQMLTLEFDSTDGAGFPDEWSLARVEMIGPLDGTGAGMSIAGDRLHWDAREARGGLEGTPALIASGEGFIESPLLEMDFDNQGELTAMRGVGPGSAFFAASGIASDQRGLERESIALSWTDGISCDVGSGVIDISGGVTLTGADYSGSARRITVLMGPAHETLDGLERSRAGETEDADEHWLRTVAARMSGFEASGEIVFSDEAVTVRGERASYQRADDLLALAGAPARVCAEGVSIRARRFRFDRSAGVIEADGECRIEISTLGAVGQPGDMNVVVTARHLTATIDDDLLRVLCTGAVGVRWGRSTLSSETLEVSGIPLGAIDSDIESDIEVARVIGSGNVVFRRDELSARCGSFSFDALLDALELFPAEGEQVEISLGDMATVWSDEVTINEEARRAVCAQPRAVLWARGSMLGFREQGRAGERASDQRARIDLSAGDELVLIQETEESITLDFSGGVEVTRWDPRSPIEDRLTASTLRLTGLVEPPEQDVASPLEKVVRVIAGLADGDVYLRYWGPDGTLEARGDRFQWEAESDVGRLVGTPAVAWLSGRDASATQRADEFLYSFTEGRVELIGGGEGVLVLPRYPAR